MAQQLFTVDGNLWVETCHRCKTPFAMSEQIYDTMLRLREGGKFYCPLGHQQHYVTGETELDKMRRRAERAEQNVAFYESRTKEEREAKEETRRQLSAQKGATTRIKNRIGHGVCPCCNRSFGNLQKHMSTKHKGYSAEAA